MSVDTLTAIRLGYGGSGKINGTVVPVTSGSMENSVSVQYQSAYLLPNNTTSRSRILHADGTVTHTGTIGFDLTNDALYVVKTILGRGRTFSVELNDGTYGKRMTNCYATSITLGGSPSGLLTGSVSFTSAFPAESQSNSGTVNRRDDFSKDFIPYWWSGNSYVRDWSFNFTQNVQAKFSNKNVYNETMISQGILASSPVYMSVGEIDASLDFTTFCPLLADNVHIATSVFRITGRTTSTGFNLNGTRDLGTYKYSIQSHALGSNDASFLTIT